MEHLVLFMEFQNAYLFIHSLISQYLTEPWLGSTGTVIFILKGSSPLAYTVVTRHILKWQISGNASVFCGQKMFIRSLAKLSVQTSNDLPNIHD